MQRIAIIGAGWLGLPLAQHLQQAGHWVCASRTSQPRLEELQAQGITGFLCQLPQANTLAETLAHFHCDTLIGCFPPGFRQGQGMHYTASWQTLVTQAKRAKIKKIIMVSSTSVYPDQAQDMLESDASWLIANQHPHFSEKSKMLLTAEQAVIDSDLDYTLLRCSGLIGPNRHPARFAARLSQVSDLAPANMLHLIDAIRAIDFSINHLTNEVVNVTTPNTVSKASFYQAALKAAKSETPLPPLVHVADKRILCSKLLQAGFSFHYSHTLEALDNNE
ncbi:NAD-dependent epimerase/dehydratase family protein [Vibrio cincinnatiensis]|uniref:NAD(P)H-binding protein n=1 Tax=Vibrio cincinnatiensis TaxID=675 RepID=UPI001EDD6E12|nr:NAD(P)H-binding protein [Vibrio cincinnatiensis]MCG3724429.1 NAD-dependent epimerase/dehydratase family protein [Vibrio cincinnatiensis]MCG3758615.1 NAD-dependent epimerase/dehydratase family protein [Vibrio cincinnatiensis]MCG3761890.1 NAD-dependent epimerase/dehydratase family protein [Vibrio cincinnatiensis]